MRLPASAVLLLAACSHTDPFPTGPAELQGPFAEETALQLTFNPGDDYGATWTADGLHVLYAYSGETFNMAAGSRCIGMLPVSGGTRSYRLCDGRSLGDSASMFLATAFRPTGELMFQQGIGLPLNSLVAGVGGSLYPTTIQLMLVDTAAPLHTRRELASFPRLIGDNTIEFLTDAEWIDTNNVVMIANRMTFPGRPSDTLPVPVVMARGVVTPDTFTLTPIAGTERATHWSRTASGEMLFVRGDLACNRACILEESAIMRVALGGGTAELFATTPDGGAVRGLSCQGSSCLVLTNVLWLMQIDSRQFVRITLPVGINPANWSNPRLSPDGNTILFRTGRNLFLIALMRP